MEKNNGGARSFLSMSDISSEETEDIIARALQLKREPISLLPKPLKDRQVALIFEKPSTRTRVSFEVGVIRLGGHPLYLDSSTMQIGRGESIEDTARAMERYVHMVVWRTFEQNKLNRFAASCQIPVVNALSDGEHPCQTVADLMTVCEVKGRLKGIELAYIGDGNNVASSLLLGAALTGMNIRMAFPKPYGLSKELIRKAGIIADSSGGTVNITEDPFEACRNAEVLYTDVWLSMGHISETDKKKASLRGYRLDSEKLKLASADPVVMHCLPAHRGDEITDEVIDGKYSIVWQQAENRLHSQMALMEFLMSASGSTHLANLMTDARRFIDRIKRKK